MSEQTPPHTYELGLNLEKSSHNSQTQLHIEPHLSQELSRRVSECRSKEELLFAPNASNS